VDTAGASLDARIAGGLNFVDTTGASHNARSAGALRCIDTANGIARIAGGSELEERGAWRPPSGVNPV
jgi:hypothetical protein